MFNLWKFLQLLVSPHVGDDDDLDPNPNDDVDPNPNDDLDPNPNDDDDLDPNPNDDDDLDPEPAPRETRAQKEIRTLRERAQAAEDAKRKLEADLATARSQPSQPQQPTQDQVLWEQEEQVLRNPEASDWQKYAVQSAREARQARQASQNAIIRAEDLADKSAFDRIRSEKPKLYEAYKDRVESMLTEIRGRGQNAPREKLLAILVGEDMLAGKLKTIGSKTTSGSKRPATPGARSDVNARGSSSMSEAEKRAKRLENIRI